MLRFQEGVINPMSMPKRKPNYNPTSTMQELLTAVCDYYGDPVDDRQSEDPDHISLHDVADEFDIIIPIPQSCSVVTMLKVQDNCVRSVSTNYTRCRALCG